MDIVIIKRNGQVENYDVTKIDNALISAFEATNTPWTGDVLDDIKDDLYLEGGITVEELQDQIEEALFNHGHFNVMKAYMLYREGHKHQRIVTERIDYMHSYVNSTGSAASASETDANANVLIKNVANLEGEVHKTTNRAIQRRLMRYMLKKLYPEFYKQYEVDLEHHIIYTHDEASSPVPKNYCEAVSLYPMMLEGVGNIDGVTPDAPHNLDSFCGQIVNLAFLLSAQCKGAVAFGGLFVAFNYYCVMEWGPNYYEKDGLRVTSEYCKKQRTISDRIEQAFQAIVYGWNQPAGNRSYQSPFTNVSYYDENYFNALFSEFYYPDGTQPEWKAINYLQKKFMKWFNKERTKVLLTFPVETMALLTDGKDIIDKEYKDFTAEMYSEGHSFFTYLSDNPNGLASCCRLRNEILENEFSFTNGLSGIQTGSCNVITLNINRIVQDCLTMYHTTDKGIKPVAVGGNWQDQLKEYLISILDRVYKYHIAYKTILYDWEKAGMFTSCNAGYIHMNKLFSTIGLNGVNEAAMFLGIDVSYNKEYQQFCELITGTIKEQNKIHSTPKFRFNTEFVPAEGLSSKNYRWDKEDGYWVPEDRVLYNSYFYDAHDNTSVLDKFRLHGKEFTSTLDGE